MDRYEEESKRLNTKIHFYKLDESDIRQDWTIQNEFPGRSSLTVTEKILFIVERIANANNLTKSVNTKNLGEKCEECNKNSNSKPQNKTDSKIRHHFRQALFTNKFGLVQLFESSNNFVKQLTLENKNMKTLLKYTIHLSSKLVDRSISAGKDT
ncbi:Hypothetical protein CINCED_3A024348 [Cinara cedri]|uniref:Uncharacterized protein n=1 Tax=Cinara cedri TaxID=506608 RepID=A0A5E4MAP5_9HEMI|nr:Hypothetical protein CINCED_3A024348 [Cinara cedri]